MGSQCIMKGAMCLLSVNLKIFTQAGQASALQIRQESPGNLQRINSFFLKGNLLIHCLMFEKTVIEHQIMPHKSHIPTKFMKLAECFICHHSILYHVLCDACQLLNILRYFHPGIDEHTE